MSAEFSPGVPELGRAHRSLGRARFQSPHPSVVLKSRKKAPLLVLLLPRSPKWKQRFSVANPVRKILS